MAENSMCATSANVNACAVANDNHDTTDGGSVASAHSAPDPMASGTVVRKPTPSGPVTRIRRSPVRKPKAKRDRVNAKAKAANGNAVSPNHVADGDPRPFPPELAAAIDKSLAALDELDTNDDPLLPSAVGEVHAICMSAVSRDGHIGELAARCGISEAEHLVLVPDVTVSVTTQAMGLVHDHEHKVLEGIDLPADGKVRHPYRPDLTFMDLRTGRGHTGDVKRGGQLGCKHRVRLVHDLGAASLLIRNVLAKRKLEVQTGRSFALVLHGDGPKLPEGMRLSVEEFDAHFGTRVGVLVQEALRRHRAGLARILQPRMRAATDELDALIADHGDHAHHANASAADAPDANGADPRAEDAQAPHLEPANGNEPDRSANAAA